MKQSSDDYQREQTERRLQKILHGAFSGPPTPLKDIPKKSGVTRAPKSKKTARPFRKGVYSSL
jgi:hypothetical protein